MDERTATLQLPPLAMTTGDVSRLLREVTMLSDYLQQQALRKGGQPMGKLPKTSRLLDELAEDNKLNLLDARARDQLVTYLRNLARHAPVVHLSFAVDPPPVFLQQIVVWFRTNTQQPVLVRVGLQPSIAAGCVIRTPNHSFDFSLRRHLLEQRHHLREAIAAAQQRAMTRVPEPAPAVTAAPGVPHE